MAGLIERLEIWIDAHGAGAKKEIESVRDAAKSAGIETGKFDTALQRLGLSGRISAGVLNTAVGTAVAAVGVAMTKAAIDGAHAFEQTAEKVRDFANISGFSAETASRWVEVAGDYQVSSDKISLAVSRLAKNIGNGAQDFAKYGIEVKRTTDGNVDLQATLFNVIDAMNQANDETTTAAIGNAAFGRGWQDLSNLITQGSDRIRSSLQGVNAGQVFTAADIERAEQYRLATDALGDSMESIKLEIGSAVAPIITSFDTVLSANIDTADSAARALGFQGLGGAIVDLVSMMVPGIGTLRALGGEMQSVGTVTLIKAQTDEEAAAAAYRLAAAQDRVAFSAEQAAAALRAATASAGSMASQWNGLQSDLSDIAEIQERLANGGRTLAEIQGDEEKAAKSGASAAKGLADAQRGVEDAERRVTDQTERLAEAQDKANQANLDAEEATRKLAQAQEALNEAKKYDPSELVAPQEANARASRNVEEAKFRVADAQDKVSETEAAYQDLLKSGTGTVAQINRADRDRRRAQLELAQAQQDVTDATREQQAAAGDLTAVDLGLKSSSGDLEDATKKVEDATRKLKDAQDAQKEAAKQVTDQQRGLEDANRAVEDAQRRLTEQQTASDGYSKDTHQPTIKTEKQLRDELNQKMEDAIAKALGLAQSTGDEQKAQQELSDQLNKTTTPAWLATNLQIEAQAEKLRDLAREFGEGSEGYNRLQALAGLQEKIIQNNNAGTIASYPLALDLLAPEELAKINRVTSPAAQQVNVNIDGQNIIKILLPGIMSAISAQG